MGFGLQPATSVALPKPLPRLAFREQPLRNPTENRENKRCIFLTFGPVRLTQRPPAHSRFRFAAWTGCVANERMPTERLLCIAVANCSPVRFLGWRVVRAIVPAPALLPTQEYFASHNPAFSPEEVNGCREGWHSLSSYFVCFKMPVRIGLRFLQRSKKRTFLSRLRRKAEVILQESVETKSQLWLLRRSG